MPLHNSTPLPASSEIPIFPLFSILLFRGLHIPCCRWPYAFLYAALRDMLHVSAWYTKRTTVRGTVTLNSIFFWSLLRGIPRRSGRPHRARRKCIACKNRNSMSTISKHLYIPYAPRMVLAPEAGLTCWQTRSIHIDTLRPLLMLSYVKRMLHARGSCWCGTSIATPLPIASSVESLRTWELPLRDLSSVVWIYQHLQLMTLTGDDIDVAWIIVFSRNRERLPCWMISNLGEELALRPQLLYCTL